MRHAQAQNLKAQAAAARSSVQLVAGQGSSSPPPQFNRDPNGQPGPDERAGLAGGQPPQMPRSASNPGMQPARYGPSAGMPGRPAQRCTQSEGQRHQLHSEFRALREVCRSLRSDHHRPRRLTPHNNSRNWAAACPVVRLHTTRETVDRGVSRIHRGVHTREDRAGLVVAAAWARQCRAAQQRMRAALSPMDASTIRHAADRFLLRALTAAAATSEAFSRARSSSTPVAPSRARSSNDLARQQASLLGRSCRLGKVPGLGACIIHRSRIRARREGPGRFLLQDHQGWGILADTALAQNSARPGLWAHSLRAGSFNRHPEATLAIWSAAGRRRISTPGCTRSAAGDTTPPMGQPRGGPLPPGMQPGQAYPYGSGPVQPGGHSDYRRPQPVPGQYAPHHR